MDAYDRALKLLAMREHSVKELKNKLVSKGYGKEEIEDAVQMLIGEGSLSDRHVDNVGLIQSVFDLTCLDIFHSLRNVHGNRSGLRVRH